MIEIKNLNKIYLKGKKNMVHALNNINLKIDDRETVAIIGESGAGKSTLLHIMSCIDNFDGEYYLDNIDFYEVIIKGIIKKYDIQDWYVHRDRRGLVISKNNTIITESDNLVSKTLLSQEDKDLLDRLEKNNNYI